MQSGNLCGINSDYSINQNGKVAASTKARRRALASLVAAITVVDCTSRLHATTQTSTWVGTTSSSWNNAANWNPNNTSPNNGNASISDFDVVIPSVATEPILNVTATIDLLTLNTSATLGIQGSFNLTLNGSAITDNGVITVNSNNSSSSTLDFVSATLSGTGTITLNSGGAGAVVAGTLIQSSGNTINGLGEITAALTNNGTVNANVSGQAITLSTSGMTNNSVMEATSGGVLSVSGITVTQGGSGAITAAASSTVDLTNATITDGTLSTSGGGIIQTTGGSTDTIASITNSGTLNIVGNSNLNVTGNLLDNGTITINSNNSSSSTMSFAGGTLSGSGTITLNSGTIGAVLAGTLIQSSGHTIDGYGEITAALTNNGLVNATVVSNTLFVDGAAMTNTSTMEATTGVLAFNNGVAVTNTGGTIAAVGNTVVLNNATITGGTLKATSPNVILVQGATFSGLTVAVSTTVDVQGAFNLTLTGSTLNDNGTIALNYNNSSSSTLQVNSNDLLTGTGTLTLDSSGAGAVIATGTGDTLTQSANHTINGLGEIVGSFINNSTVNANVSGQAITLVTSNMTNNNLMEATGGGVLAISGITLTQGIGAQLSAAGGTVELVAGATVSGGTLNSSSGGVIEATSSSTDTLANVTNNATFNIVGVSNVNITGNLVNNGVITVNSNASSTATIGFSGGTLSGTGSIALNSGSTGAVVAGTLTLSSGQTINGVGEITAGLTNNGTVNANLNGQTITLLTNAKTNNSLMEATGGGIVGVNGITVTQGSGGSISASGNSGGMSPSPSIVNLINATITDGTLSSSGGGIIQATGSSTSTIASVTNNATLNIIGVSNLDVTGNLLNNGAITVNSNGSSDSTLNFGGGTLSGTGTITLNSGSTSAVLAGTLTQSSGHTINGFGEITAALTNNGLVNATVNGGTLFVSSSAITNTSTMEATTGPLTFNNSVAVTNTGGTIAAVGNNVTFNDASITGGTLESTSPNVILVQNATFNGLTIAANTTVDVQGAFDLTLTGSTLTDNGSILLNYNNSATSTLQVNSNDLLTGTGTLTLGAANSSAVIATGTGDTLTQDVNHTINGLGEIAGSFINNGTVNANSSGNSITLLTTSNMTNNSLMEATGGGVLAISGITLTQGSSGQLSAAGGTVELVAGATVSGGTLNSSSGGVIEATGSSTDTLANVTNNATFNIVGNSSLNVTGNLVDNGLITVNSNGSATSTLDFASGTLSGTGTITLNSGSTGAVVAGTLIQSSGHTINGFGEITAALTNNGTVNANVSGQTIVLTTGPMTNNSVMEATGGGSLNISSVTITQGAGGQIKASGGTVNLTGGATVTGGTLSGGTVNNSSGTNTIGGLTNTSTLNVVGNTDLNISSTIVNNGVIAIDSNSSSTSTVSATGAITGTGTLVINSGGKLAFALGAGGSSQDSLSIAASTSLDLNNNHFIIDYGAGPDPFTTIAGYVKSGYNGGNWNGPGIMSTAAQTLTNGLKYGLGYADGKDGKVSGLTSGQIEVKYTLLGDANLDGLVNAADFTILAANFNQPVTSWDQGDFNYDGLVNAADFTDLAANFNQPVSGAAVSAGDVAALDAFATANGLSLPTSSVPEPATTGLVALAGLGMLSRRRRRGQRCSGRSIA